MDLEIESERIMKLYSQKLKMVKITNALINAYIDDDINDMELFYSLFNLQFNMFEQMKELSQKYHELWL
jgi:hypothetical protein